MEWLKVIKIIFLVVKLFEGIVIRIKLNKFYFFGYGEFLGL